MKNILQKTAGFLIPLLLALCLAGQASACSLFYFGGDLTDDGANLFFRGEDQDGVYYMINTLTDRSGEYHVYPEGWDHSYRSTFIALANALDFLQGEAEKEAYADRCLEELQQKFIAAFPGLTARLAAGPDLQAREEIMTREHMQMSEEAQNLALKLYRHLVYGEPINHSDLK